MFSADELSAVFFVDSAGLLWRRFRNGTRPAGNLNGDGYRQVGFRSKKIYAHQIVWCITYGEWPSHLIDHKNRKRDDNRPLNLRRATRSQNAVNSKTARSNTSGVKGVSWSKAAQKWTARIRSGHRYLYLGIFASIEEAADAYRAAATEVHGEFMPPACSADRKTQAPSSADQSG